MWEVNKGITTSKETLDKNSVSFKIKMIAITNKLFLIHVVEFLLLTKPLTAGR